MPPRAQIYWLTMGTPADRSLVERLASRHEVNTANRVEGDLSADFDLLLVDLDRRGGDELLAALGRIEARPGVFVVLDRGASQRQLAEAFRLGAEDCLSVALGPALAAERIHHLCRRILAERSL